MPGLVDEVDWETAESFSKGLIQNMDDDRSDGFRIFRQSPSLPKLRILHEETFFSTYVGMPGGAFCFQLLYWGGDGLLQ